MFVCVCLGRCSLYVSVLVFCVCVCVFVFVLAGRWLFFVCKCVCDVSDCYPAGSVGVFSINTTLSYEPRGFLS